MKWDRLRRQLWFRWLLAFVVLVLIGKFLIRDSWGVVLAYAVGMATGLTAVFAFIGRPDVK